MNEEKRIDYLEHTIYKQRIEIQTLRAENLELRTSVVEKALHNGDQLTELKQLRAKLAKYEVAVKCGPVAWVNVPEGDQLDDNYPGYEFFGLSMLVSGKHYLYTRPAPIPEGHISLPQTEDDAATMAILGVNWLQGHAPHRLKNTIPEGYVPVPKERETGGWIWCWLMDYVREMGVSPDRQARLFRLVSDYRAMLTAAEEGK